MNGVNAKPVSVEPSALVWVFNTNETRSPFPCGVWSSKTAAEQWITKVGAVGTLSAYVLDEPAYETCLRLGHFGKPPVSECVGQEFQRNFTTAIDHYHYRSPDDEAGVAPP
jgi:hypothetical protein